VIPVRVELTFSLVKSQEQSHILLRNHYCFLDKWPVVRTICLSFIFHFLFHFSTSPRVRSRISEVGTQNVLHLH
jgi:hypothetical protein